MRNKNSDTDKHLAIKILSYGAALFLFCLLPVKGWSQTESAAVNALVEMGFENVACSDEADERVYVLQNSAYRLQGVGIGKAVDVIQEIGMPDRKPCRIIVLDNNVPQLSLYYKPIIGDSVPEVERRDWEVTYDLGDSWKNVRKKKRNNSSLFKVDILVYPQLYFKNVIITQVYQACLELSPAVEVSLWRGSKVTAQVIFPVYNDGYPGAKENIRPGYLTLEQDIRLPYNIWVKAVVGVFNSNCFGGEVSFFHPFKNEHFSVEGKFGLVGVGYFNDFNTFRYNGETRWYWSVGGNYYWARYNTQFKFRAEQYLLKEMGLRAEVIRHFRYASVGLYALVSNEANSNGGFRFIIALPPYKYKRKGYIPRISTGLGTGITYNAGNDTKHYLMPYSTADDNILKQNQFNPYFIESELVN